MIQGTIFIYGILAYALFDTSATHSFIAPHFATCFEIQPILLDYVMLVDTPIGTLVETKWIYKNCDIVINYYNYMRDLISLEFHDFDIMLCMDWLSLYNAKVDCLANLIILSPDDKSTIVFRGSLGNQ